MSRIRSIHPDLWTDAARSAGLLTHIYIMQEGDGGPCKVGISRNAFWRRSDLQCGNWRPIQLRHLFSTDDRGTAVQVEAAVLNHFKSERLNGEWLTVSPDVVRLFIEEEFGDGAN